ncbi:riboflavin synthase subunit alpha [Candidatus Kaiserbacteria bacterium RIFCSPLOWO2_01_FULL_53_17]|uniref:Riboflavin synthase n=1 Tax=Candidatus Kaiserbacteria bacterium RIFCSPLOWO2_01_FULL_53_17 TaxID=1798511 RepID=A0A1F6EHR6_9BACT|nr:MAG: riboflavin synthase subunit alpha [Candidatus Kaiserbacteria bacterium RIFCSPLOWO2_01_FULL_53_17]
MFTGIVEAKGKVLSAEGKGSMRVRIAKPHGWTLKKGQSISVDGICSTVERFGAAYFDVTYMPETLRVSTAGDFKEGRAVNLERSLRAGDPIDGHIVQGHVGGVGIVKGVRKRGMSEEITITMPRPLMRFIAPKGSIAVSGVSLTIAARKWNSFTVALIPHTLVSTTLGALAKGSWVNIETDLIARYLAQLGRK